jgi:hypothetical protein
MTTVTKNDNRDRPYLGFVEDNNHAIGCNAKAHRHFSLDNTSYSHQHEYHSLNLHAEITPSTMSYVNVASNQAALTVTKLLVVLWCLAQFLETLGFNQQPLHQEPKGSHSDGSSTLS